MGLDGTQGRQTEQTRRAVGLPPQRALPFDLAAWAAEPRPEAAPGVFRLGHTPGDPQRAEDAAVPAGPLLLRAALNLVVACIVFLYGRELCLWALRQLGVGAGLGSGQRDLVALAVNVVVLVAVVRFFGRMGRWTEVFRRYVRPVLARTVTHEAPAAEQESAEAPGTTGRSGPADPWQDVRAAAPPRPTGSTRSRSATSTTYGSAAPGRRCSPNPTCCPPSPSRWTRAARPPAPTRPRPATCRAAPPGTTC
ncbi:hypothetical protein GCM10025734_32910 [Kitasatospora paranensis]|uniref:hypothetical protein n=1 Tax=Kitasatospora paranensis TaxID=258053 RepID=UPI0031EA6870